MDVSTALAGFDNAIKREGYREIFLGRPGARPPRVKHNEGNSRLKEGRKVEAGGGEKGQ